jgi:hypothetical protein
MKDILEDKSIKAMPYGTPDGYFEGLKTSLQQTGTRKTILWKRPAYAAIAAGFALFLAIGSFFLGRASENNFTQEDYIVFSDEMTNAIFYDDKEIYADALSEDDIIEYLIYNDIEIEELY